MKILVPFHTAHSCPRRRPIMSKSRQVWLPIVLVLLATLGARAHSFRVQCPASTITHPQTGTNCSANPTGAGCNNTEPPYNGPTQFGTQPVSGANGGYVVPTPGTVNGAIKCQQISGGDGYSTMADGTQTFMFSFGPLSGLADIAAGKTGAQFPNVFNTLFPGLSAKVPTGPQPGDPATTDGAAAYAGGWGSGGAP